MVKSNWYIKMIPIIMVTIICLMFLPFVLGSEEVSVEGARLMEESTVNAEDVTIEIDGLNLNFNAKFKQVGEIARFEIIVNNPTSVEYELELGTTKESEYIIYDNDLTDTSLKANTEKVFHITLTYDNSVPENILLGGNYTENNTFNILLNNDTTLIENNVEENITNVVENTSVENNTIESNEIKETNTIVDNKDYNNSEKETILDKIKDKTNNPKTNDNIALWISISILAIAGTTIFVYYPSRKIYLGATVVTIALIIIIPITTFASVKKKIIVNTNVEIVSKIANKTKVKYAVQIYGIGNDLDEEEHYIGLTFGPATGDNYNNKYVTHEYEVADRQTEQYFVKIITHIVASDGTETTTSEYLEDSEGNKVIRSAEEKDYYNINLHNMTWKEIKQTHANRFYDCMLCGDTKAVTLYLNDIVGTKRENKQYGDGVGTINYSIRQYYRLWNPAYNSSYTEYNNTAAVNGGSDGSIGKNAGGYSSSHIRATLVGENDKTNYDYAGDVNLTEDTCIYSCIEEDLRNVITAKRVTYVTGTTYTSGNYTVNSDIVDKIWLLSATELHASGYLGGEDNIVVDYGKFSDSSSKYYLSSYSNSNKEKRDMYNERGENNFDTCLRSINLNTGIFPRVVTRGGVTTYLSGNYQYFYQISFGFCIDSSMK